MNKFLQAFTAFIIWSVFALLFHYYLSDKLFGPCATNHKNQENETLVPEKTSVIKTEDFIITDDKGKKITDFKGKFIIKSGTDTVMIPPTFNPIIDSIQQYLSKNTSSNLFIVVNYLKSEIDKTSGSHLGQKRAEFLKNRLVQNNIPSDRISIETQLSEFHFDEKNQNYDAITLYFKDLIGLKASNAAAIVANKTLRFSFGNQSFRPSDELIDYVFELKSYLSQYPNKKVYIVGHTDSEGDAEFNYNIGLKRAQFVKDFLITQQIESYKIVSESKGETEPIADNTTREGKSLNRRIEIIIK